MKVSLKLCLLFSLISPVVVLTCEKCIGRHDQCSRRISQICPKHAVCKNYLFNSNVFPITVEAGKSCVDSNFCDAGEYSLTTSGGGFLKMLVDCCTTDNCNSKPLKFSPESREPNGLECEGCHVEDQETCEGVEKVRCLGEQTKCISMRISHPAVDDKLKATDFITKGCATPLFCREVKVNKNFAFSQGNELEVSCYEAIFPANVSSLA